MTQAINLANFANNLNSSGQVDPNALSTVVPIAKGGTNASTAADARTSLNVPTRTGGDSSGTWPIGISGNAATVTNGVYTTGNQTIGGTKTFTSGIKFNDDTVQTTAAVTPTTNVQTFNSTGTWTKPTAGQTMARIQVWGGGGGGSRFTSNDGTSGGGGGGYNETTIPISYLAATVTATVGSGGTGATSSGVGGTGGTSSFALATSFMGRSTVAAYGGGGGQAGAQNGSSGGGAQLSAGAPGSGASSNGIPYSDNWSGGRGTGSTTEGGTSDGGNSLFGGGGGCCNGATAGVSLYGGAGGAGAAGTQPGGGGGSKVTANLNGSNGGAGRIIVTCW